jgi:hypothetical protein
MADGRSFRQCRRAPLPSQPERVNPRVAGNSVARTARTVARDRKIGAIVLRDIGLRDGVRRDGDTVVVVTRVLH